MPMIMVNDIRMHYEITGKGDPILLIAGFSTDITHYSKIIKELSLRYKVIAFDNRGAGRTDKPDKPYTIETMANDAITLLKKLRINRVNLLGFSMGGQIAMTFAIKYPKNTKNLILVSTMAGPIPQTFSWRLINSLLEIPVIRKMSSKYPQPYYAVKRQAFAAKTFDARRTLHKIKAPTIILHGSWDSIVPHRFAKKMHSQIRNSRMITFDAGHLFLFFRHEQFIQIINDFLSR